MAESQARAVPVEDETSKPPPKFTTIPLGGLETRLLDVKPGFRPSTTLRYSTHPVHRNAQTENEGYTEDEYRRTLHGTAYLEDNRKFALYLQETIRGHTTAYNHCSDKLQAQLGWQAFMALVSQYEGAGNVINQISAAEKALNLLHYKGHEATFRFNDYFAQAKKYFRTLALDPTTTCQINTMLT